MQHAGYGALAFGVPLPATPGRYLDLDLVAMAINLGLTRWLGREMATTIVVAFFPQWASAVGHAEAEPNKNFLMAVAGVDWDAAKKSPNLLLVTYGTTNQIAEDFHDTKNLVGYFSINISDIIRRLRERAHVAGIDLSRPFFFPPDDPQFGQILMQVKRERNARIERLRRDKKKFAVMKARCRRQNIAAAYRVKSVIYPPEMMGVE